MISQDKKRSHARNAVKVLGFIGAVGTALALAASGQYVEAVGIVAAALSSPLRREQSGA